MAPSFSRISSGALLLALAYNARPVKADYWEDVANCELVLHDLPADLSTNFCHDWTSGGEEEIGYVTVTGYPVTVTEYPGANTCEVSTGYEPAKTTSAPAPPPTDAPKYDGDVVTVTSTVLTTYTV